MVKDVIRVIVSRLVFCRHLLLRGWSLLTLPFLAVAVVQGIRDELPKSSQDQIPPLLELLSWEGWLVVGMAVLLLVVIEGAYRLSTQQVRGSQLAPVQPSVSPREHLAKTIRELMQEGNQILDAVANVNQALPAVWGENWFRRGTQVFEDNLGKLQVMDWQSARRPKQGFTGLITPDRKQLWDSIKGRVEVLEEIDNELRGR